MGLTKQYLRFEAHSVFGLVAGFKSNVVFLTLKGVHNKFCAVGACEDVIIWDTRTEEKVATLKGEKHEVTRIVASPDGKHLAVGYSDGMVRVFHIDSREITINFSGHKSAVTALQYDMNGLHLVSGSKDTDVIVWDIVNESGLYRLKGHKGPITKAMFLQKRNVLITSSKDTFVKFWDLDTQHCFLTLVGHRSEVYDFVVVRDGHRLITGSADSELRVWDISYISEMDVNDGEPTQKRRRIEVTGREGQGHIMDREEDAEEDYLTILKCTKVGSVMRQGRDRVVSMATDIQERILLCHGNSVNLEMFKLPSDHELKKHLSKRQKKLNKKNREEEKSEIVNAKLTLDDEIQRHTEVKMESKIVALDVVLDSAQTKIIALLNNNTIHCCSLNMEVKKSEPTNPRSLAMLGHRSDVRTLDFSSDNTALLSASGESVKVWNRATLQCIRTMSCDYALCSMFAPGDRHIILGTKTGKLQIFDVASGCLQESIEAHSGAVWSIHMAPDKRGIVSGSADKLVKFWNFELVTDEDSTSTSKRLTLEHQRTLQMDEDVLGVKYSGDNRLLAVSLLDNTVKVFFTDTLKFFLSLYGHKLPVLCIDISTDSTLLVSGSADRNVKIWGLDFGDCHKSLFAHDDSIMCIQFIPKTHLFFTGSKDGKIKQWDADNFEHILTLSGHHAEVWCLATSPSGKFLVSGSHDKSIRLWEKTQEPLVLEDEREQEREKEFEDSIGEGGEPVVPGETNTEVGMAGRKTSETVKGAEKIIESLELYKEEMAKSEQYKAECERSDKPLPPPQPHPLMLAFQCDTPLRYMMEMLKKVRSSELEESLLVLPFNYVVELIRVLEKFLDNGWDVELVCRCLFFLLRVHHGQITSSPVLLPVVDRLRKNTLDRVNEIRDRIGFNLTGLQYLQREIEHSEGITMFTETMCKVIKKKKDKVKKQAILSFKV